MQGARRGGRRDRVSWPQPTLRPLPAVGVSAASSSVAAVQVRPALDLDLDLGLDLDLAPATFTLQATQSATGVPRRRRAWDCALVVRFLQQLAGTARRRSQR